MTETAELEADYRTWYNAMFPSQPTESWMPAHHELAEWEWEFTPSTTPEPLVQILPRGWAKSTRAERLCISSGARQMVDYVLYVGGTQKQADKHLSSIGHDLETNPQIERHYPDLATRAVNKYNYSRGWSTSRLTTARGLVIEAMGLDTAARGVRFDERRPRLVILDDIDDASDSLDTIAAKERTLTHDILPALADNGTVLVAQNVIHRNGIVAKLADGRAEYLYPRRVIGPIKAIDGLEYERLTDAADAAGVKALITGGVATWPQVKDIAACQRIINTTGIDAFLAECQHDVGYVGELRLNRQAIDAHKETVRPPLPLAALPVEWRTIKGLKVWELPSPGLSYGAYTDPAEGKGRDYCASGIAAITEKTARHIASYRNKDVETAAHAEAFWRVLEAYGLPWWGYERAKGEGIALVQGRTNYPRMVPFSDGPATLKQRAAGTMPTQRYGFQMTNASKAKLIADFATAYETFEFTSPDEDLHNECGVFLTLDGNRMGAAPGEHDDLVIMAAGLVMLALRPETGRREPVTPKVAVRREVRIGAGFR